ncbi:hypothetical protein Moror_10285 [Moniliophthora roreri MCA 2997]|uniref:BTB domain-containing protein n=1 Tax=Moniliophthora roreri (strain MCA 2997) TaxID=1381753 RepID=V2WZ54_MONRO|nr:hypothetical protein Moror_10285 [Moniliophthora roreri MCA 2997]
MTQELASANEATKPVSTTGCTPNQYFFLQPVIFQVDDELFQIPDTLFPASETFKKLYPAILEGNTPVVLRDCTKRQFEAFLIIVLQPHSHMFNGKHPCNYPPLLEFLLPAFELAKKWGFHQLALDIGHQAGLLMSSPVQKVAVGHRYAVLPWYRSGLEELVTSDDDITLEDAGEIGFPLALRLYHARAKYARGMRDRRYEDHGTVASEIVESMFAEDLAIFPASRSEVIESEGQPCQAEQTDETDTETVMVTAPAEEEDFEVVSQSQEQPAAGIIPSSESEGAHDAKEPNNSVQQEQPNEGTILSEGHSGNPLAEPPCSSSAQTVTNTEPTGTNEETKPDSKSETYTTEAQSSSSAVINVATHPEIDVHGSSGTNERNRQIIRAFINSGGAGRHSEHGMSSSKPKVLTYSHPSSHMFNGKHPCNYPLLLETLLPALELAKKWGFHQLAQDIGHQAGPLMSSPVQRIAVGHHYGVLPWYRSGLEDLVASDEDITLEDAEDIGFPLALRLYHARARYARNIRDRTLDDKRVIVSEIVGSIFAEDLTVFPVSRSEVIESEDQPRQVEQTIVDTVTETNEGFEVVAQQERMDTEVILPEGQTPSHTVASATKESETASEAQAKKNVETNPSDPNHEHHVASNSNDSDASALTGSISTDIARDLIRAIIDQTALKYAYLWPMIKSSPGIACTFDSHPLPEDMKWYPQEPVLTQSEFKPATTNCKPNPYFFLQSIIFQVADELFQIPSIVFPESEIFNELYPGVLERNGAPVVLRDCTKRQFEALLTVVLHPYSQMFTSRHPCKELLHLQVLLPALELAKKWCFHRLCQDISAQSGLLMSSPVEKVTFGLRYTVQSWFHRGLEQLIASDDDISQKDAEAVGLPLALRVYRARAKYAKGARGDSEITTTDVSDIVKDMFADELAMFSTSASDTDETESLLNTESEAETIVVTSAPDGSFVEVGQHQTPSSLTSSEYVTSKDPPPTHAPLGASKSTSTNAATPESSDGQTDGAILDETQKKVVEDAEDTKPSKTCTPNPHFFLKPVVFQVDDELFQIPDTVFPVSEKFRELYPTISEENEPVILKDCTKEQFGAFLTVILQPYSRMFPETHPCNLPHSLESLIPALDLSTKWGFRQLTEDIGAQAGQFLTSAIQKLSLGWKCMLPLWYRPGLEELVQSDEDITLEEAEEIGLAFTIRVYHARARYAREMRDITLPGDNRTEISIISEIIEYRFADELERFQEAVSEALDDQHSAVEFGVHDESEVGTVVVTEDEVPETPRAHVPNVAATQHTDWNTAPSTVNPVSSLEEAIASSSSSVTQPSEQATTSTHANPVSIEIQRLVLRAIVNSLLRVNVTILSNVPKTCQQSELRCGRGGRCRSCCIKEARRYRKLGWMPQPKSTIGRIILDTTVWSEGREGSGFPTSSVEVLQHVPRTCERKEKQCGVSKRCFECCSNKFDELLKHGEVI